MLKKKLPLSVHIILLLIANIWIIWSFHVVIYDTEKNKLKFANPSKLSCCYTYGNQWPCYINKKFNDYAKVNSEATALTHFVPKTKEFKTIILCTSVCWFGRVGILPILILWNFIYFPNNKLVQTPKNHKVFSILGWVLLGGSMALCLGFLNWPLFIRALPGFIILLVLQFNLMLDEPRDENLTGK